MEKYQNTEGGFILGLTIVLVTAMLVVAVALVDTSRQSLEAVEGSSQALKARTAAEGGIECVRFYQGFGVFNAPGSTNYSCGDGSSVTGSFEARQKNSTSTSCTTNEDFTVTYPNNSCADVTVEADSPSGGGSGCELTVESVGKSTCGGGDSFVEQTETLLIEAQ